MTASFTAAPEWAAREFCKRANLIYDEVLCDNHERATALRFAVAQGARLIAAHEEEPVDPLETECGKIIGGMIVDSHRDSIVLRDAVMQALRRGIELAGERGK